jgi:hypothetical protein
MADNQQLVNRQYELETELRELEKQDAQQKVDAGYNYYQTEDNLIKWQLEINDIIDNLYHWFRGDSVIIKDGNRIWEARDKKDMPLNEEGVQEIIRDIYSYINKNLLLSYYDEKQVNHRLYCFGIAFADMLLMNYELLGMDTEQKQVKYELICLSVIQQVESAYRRALFGKERDSLTKKTMVHQSLNPSSNIQQGGMANQNVKKFSITKPSSWF